jgi:hypothetical protein
MLDSRDSNVYLRDGRRDDRMTPQHLVALLALLAVLYVAGSAVLTLVR